MKLPQMTPEGERVLAATVAYRDELNHGWLGVEHLFVGVAVIARADLGRAFAEHAEDRVGPVAPGRRRRRAKSNAVGGARGWLPIGVRVGDWRRAAFVACDGRAGPFSFVFATIFTII